MNSLYYLIKTLIEPYLILIVIGTFMTWRLRRRIGTPAARIAYRCFWLLWLMSLPISGWLAVMSLERQYRPPEGKLQIPDQMDAIVVLGGGMIVGDDPQDARPSLDSMMRCLHAMELGEDSTAKFILCGGRPQKLPEAPAESEAMRDFMVSLGVPAERIITETESHSTWENAQNAGKIIEERGFQHVALVTQGWHLRRAVGCFHKLNMEVIPSGCEWRPQEMRLDWYRHALPTLGGLKDCQRVLNEWIGIGWYRYKDRL